MGTLAFGGPRALEDIAAPIRGGDGAIRGVVLVFRDATERRRAERERERANDRLELALEVGRMGRVGVGPADQRRLVVRAPRACAHGLAPGTFGRTLEAFRELLHPEDRDKVAQAIERAVTERRTRRTTDAILDDDPRRRGLEGRQGAALRGRVEAPPVMGG
jgi:PAS domain-containing protein